MKDTTKDGRKVEKAEERAEGGLVLNWGLRVISVCIFHILANNKKNCLSRLISIHTCEYLLNPRAVDLILYVCVSLMGLSRNKIKNLHLLWPNAVHAYMKGRGWLKLCEYPSQPHPPTLCSTWSIKANVHGVWKALTHWEWYMLMEIDTYYSMLHTHTHTHVTYRTQTCKSQKHAQPRGRLHRVHGPCESSSEIPRAHRGCLVLPARDARSFCGGTFSSRINEKLHLSHEKSIFTIYLTSCIPKAHIRRCWLLLAYSSVFLMHSLPLLGSSVGRLPPPAAVPIEPLAFLMLPVRELSLHCRDEIWHTTGSLRDLLKKWE